MAYYALVTRLNNLHKDPNSDNLWLADCFNEGVIVGPGMKENELILYLPTDGEIERWFGDAFNLYRKNLDGTSQGGYIENNSHIRAIKLRGNQSSGVVIALDKVYEKFGDQGWKDGDKVNTINDKEFCCKYIPKRKNGSINYSKTSYKGRKAEGITYPEFSMHTDTEQLAYNLDKFRPGDMLDMTLKMHGCFIAGTKIRMADNSLKRIESVQPGEMVLGYNFETKRIEPTRVVHTFKNQPSTKWNRIRISRNYIRGDKRGTQISTWNHKYWSLERNEWVMAKDLIEGETISTLFPSPILTKMQKEVVLGLFLGDGCLIAFNERTAEIQVSQSVEHKDFLNYLEDITQGWIYINEKEKDSGYGSRINTARSVRSADLYNAMSDCSTFINQMGHQRLKEGIIKEISPLSLALWYMSDGNLYDRKNGTCSAYLAICSFDTEEDIKIIQAIFNRFGLNPVYYVDTQGYSRLRFNSKDADKFFEIIAKFIIPCMQYKLPQKWQGKFQLPVDPDSYNPTGYVLSPQEVLENTPLDEEHVEYDLETELHNYVVGLSIVHNTSQRSMNTYAELPNGFFRRLFHMKKRTKQAYVLGTRRCVVTENSQGYYGNDQFRIPHHEKIKPFVDDSMEVFYEVVGYYGNGEADTIMPIADNKKINDKNFVKKYGPRTIFSYGCKPGQSKMYVYRITSENGEREWTPDEITEWCKKAGVKRVPIIENFEFTTVEDLQNRINKYFEDLTDPIGLTHIKEGIVVRIVNRRTFTAYKSKAYEFKVLEGIVKEQANAPDMEEAEDILDNNN